MIVRTTSRVGSETGFKWEWRVFLLDGVLRRIRMSPTRPGAGRISAAEGTKFRDMRNELIVSVRTVDTMELWRWFRSFDQDSLEEVAASLQAFDSIVRYGGSP
jgi:hypothetical protein